MIKKTNTNNTNKLIEDVSEVIKSIPKEYLVGIVNLSEVFESNKKLIFKMFDLYRTYKYDTMIKPTLDDLSDSNKVHDLFKVFSRLYVRYRIQFLGYLN